MNVVYLILAGIIGYFAGAIPFGYIYVKMTKGIDLRQYESGRTGGTNSFRAAGLKVGILTGFSDVFKGAAGILLTRYLLGNMLDATTLPWAEMAAGVLSVVGHNWSIFLGWRGGAGTGPNVGWASALWWPMLPIGIVVMSGMLYFIGMASVASLSMAFIIPLIFGIRFFAGIDPTPAYFVGGILTFLIVAWALRPNIKRIMAGTERVVGPRARRMKQQANNAHS
ncbi:MAG: glycerol-3-phosphate acyltransferase [Chloroflexi bacterium]|nr:MAG: glycerol-3-phosphate acyltransferase [Chloroflexota bacterium]